MSETSVSPADNSGRQTEKILVWDLPVRLFHWLMVICFAGAWLTAESERWRLVHVTLGYTLGGLTAFRILWGLAGTRYARFSAFVRGPAAVAGYVRSLLGGMPARHVGHNPAGALAIVALLGLALLVVSSGWANFQDIGGDGMEEAHEACATAMLALVGLHVAGVVFSSWRHRENLIGAMAHGHKQGMRHEGIAGAKSGIALLLLLAVLGFWWLQGQQSPSGTFFGTESHRPAKDTAHAGDAD